MSVLVIKTYAISEKLTAPNVYQFVRILVHTVIIYQPLNNGDRESYSHFWTINDPPGLQWLKYMQSLKPRQHFLGRLNINCTAVPGFQRLRQKARPFSKNLAWERITAEHIHVQTRTHKQTTLKVMRDSYVLQEFNIIVIFFRWKGLTAKVTLTYVHYHIFLL